MTFNTKNTGSSVRSASEERFSSFVLVINFFFGSCPFQAAQLCLKPPCFGRPVSLSLERAHEPRIPAWPDRERYESLKVRSVDMELGWIRLTGKIEVTVQAVRMDE